MVSVGCQTDSPIGRTTAFDMEWNSFPTHSDLNLPEVRRELFQERTGAKSSYATPYGAFVAIWDHTLVEKNREGNQCVCFTITRKNDGTGTDKSKF
ncbi:hypothetical protein EVAR_87978_1 [Eumeta japonica]|uniref:Uncharacterized protein n=1 Tax=Eumeta variegata TaxID=151549 RepID=A0A4C1VCQ4_EUMVA|nr:hypothetical protein EVAR_87978_1 [Eumeta japonica]